MKSKINLFLPPLVWAGVIFSFSAITTTSTSQVYWQDFVLKKTAHVVEYAVFSILLYRAFKNSYFNKKTSGYLAILISFLYGVSDEFHQSFTPGREPALRDVIFDTIGAVAAIYIVWKLLPKAGKRLRNWAVKLQLL